MNKEITIIDLLNKIANRKELPKKIMYFGLIYKYCEKCKQYENLEGNMRTKLYEEISDLNDTLEIIEEEDKKIEPYTSLSNIWSEQQENELIDNFDRINTILNKLIDEINSLKEKNEN